MIVFDLDGTLVDSRPEILRAMEVAWSEVLPGSPFPRDRFRVGPPLAKAIEPLTPDHARREALARAFARAYDTSDFSATTPYEGIGETLSALAARGLPLAIATNKRRVPTLGILARWFPGRFAHVACVDGVSPDDGTRPGTKAAMVEWIMRFAQSPGVLVGDAVTDVRAARTTGVGAVAVTWGYEPASALAAEGPAALVARPGDLLAVLESVLAAGQAP